MSWSRLHFVLLLTSPFLLTSALAARGDYILGAGVSVDDQNGIAAIVVADWSVGERTWLSTSIGRNKVELPNRQDLDTWYGDISIDHFWEPAGARFGIAYWGDARTLDSVDYVAALYTRGDKGTISIDAEYRDLELELPPIDLFARTSIPFNTSGLGLSGRLKLSQRTDFRISGMSYEYNINLRIDDTDRVVRLLSISRLSLLSSLIDWRVSAGFGIDLGLQRWQLDVAKWRGAIDGGDNRSVTISFLTPMTDKTDIEISLGYDDSDLYGEVAVLNLFLYFYGID
jgi:hypothetical protein